MKLSGQHPVRVCKVINRSVAAKADILVDDSKFESMIWMYHR